MDRQSIGDTLALVFGAILIGVGFSMRGDLNYTEGTAFVVLGLLMVMVTSLRLYRHARRRRVAPDLEVWCQPTPGGRAWLVVRNNGGLAQIEAAALVVKVEESLPNPLSQQHIYHLSWGGASSLARVLGNGSEDSLLLASSERLEMDLAFRMNLMLLWGRTEGDAEPRKLDSFRWHWGEEGPVVTLEVTLTMREAPGTAWPTKFRPEPTRRTIFITGDRWGAMTAQEDHPPKPPGIAPPPADPPSSTASG